MVHTFAALHRIDVNVLDDLVAEGQTSRRIGRRVVRPSVRQTERERDTSRRKLG